MKTKKKYQTIRNSISRMPLLRKGGIHTKSKSSSRFKLKTEIKKILNNNEY